MLPRVVSLLVALTASAAAAPPVAVLPSEVSPGVLDRAVWEKDLDARIAGLLEKRNIPTVTLRGPAGCRDEACLARAAEAQKVDTILAPRVEEVEADPPDYRLILATFSRGAFRTVDTLCTGCSDFRVVENMAVLVGRFLDDLPPPPTNENANANENANDKTTKPDAPKKPKPPEPWLIGVTAATVAVSLAGIVMTSVGGKYLSDDGKCPEPPVAPARRCPQVWDSLDQGGALLGVGVGLSLIAGIALAFEVKALMKREDKPTLLPAVTRDGASLLLEGRF